MPPKSGVKDKLEVKDYYTPGGNGVEETLLLKLIAPKSEKRVFMDLVVVLDTSGSMANDNKLVKMKETMTEVFRWLRNDDRLCIVSFNTLAEVVYDMKRMDPDSKKEAASKVENLPAGGWTNMQMGLEVGLKALKEHERPDHVGVIFLMSDGAENQGSHAAKVPVENVKVETVGFGRQHEAEVLSLVAVNSKGGTYHNGNEVDKLTGVLSRPVYWNKHIVISDLELALKQEPTMRVATCPRWQVTLYPGATLIRIGDLFSEQIFRVTVTWSHPGNNGTGVTVTYKYKAMPESVDVSGPREPKVIQLRRQQGTRNRALVFQIPKKIRTEHTRLKHVAAMKEAKELADAQRLVEAQDKLAVAMNVLDDVLELPNEDVSKNTVNFLYTELEELRTRMETQDIYKQEGLPYALACISSHDCQRPTARCGVSNVGLFSTQIMEDYLQEAIKFDEKSTCTA